MPSDSFKRREALKRLGALGVMGAAGQLYSGFSFAGQRSGADQLDALTQGKVIHRRHPRYEAWRKSMVWQFNKPNRRPDAILRARSEQDVIVAVKHAAANGLKVSVRSGGHNSSGAALRKGGLLIDLSSLREVEINPVLKTARAQPGLGAAQLVQAAGEQGLAFPASHCPTVALGGYLLGGGLGWNHAHWGGVACHSIKSADIVLADGEKVVANADSFQDLFWSLRGAGPGFFGVVTRFELQLYPLPQAIRTSMYIAPIEKLAIIVKALDKLAKIKDERVEVLVLLMRNPQAPANAPPQQAAICMVGVNAFADAADEAKSMLSPFAKSELATASVFKVENQPATFAKLYNPENVDAASGRYAVDNVWTDNPGQALLSLAEHFMQTPSPRSHVLCSYGIKPELRADACFSRIARHFVACYLLWDQAENDDANYDWLKKANDLLQPYSKGHYVNEVEAARHPERVRASFSEKSWKRLAELRRKYDPGKVFHTYLGYS